MDHATTVNVAVTDDATKHDDELQALMPEGADLVLHEAEYTEAELDALHEEIFASKPLFAYSFRVQQPDRLRAPRQW